MSEQVESTRSELEREFVDIVRGLRESAEEGKEFVVHEAPLVAQEYIGYRWFADTTTVAVCLSCLLVAVVGMVNGWRRAQAAKCESETVACLTLWFVGLVATLLLLPLSVEATHQAAKVWFAPRVVILEKAAELVK